MLGLPLIFGTEIQLWLCDAAYYLSHVTETPNRNKQRFARETMENLAWTNRKQIVKDCALLLC